MDFQEGDLIATCFSENSRNRALGKLLGSGKSLEEAMREMVMVAEGVPATRVTKNFHRSTTFSFLLRKKCTMFFSTDILPSNRLGR